MARQMFELRVQLILQTTDPATGSDLTVEAFVLPPLEEEIGIGSLGQALGALTGETPAMVTGSSSPAQYWSRAQAPPGGGVSLEGAGIGSYAQVSARKPNLTVGMEQQEPSGDGARGVQRSKSFDSSEYYYGKNIREFTDGKLYPDYPHSVMFKVDEKCIGKLVGKNGEPIDELWSDTKDFVGIIISQLTDGETRQMLFYGYDREPIHSVIGAVTKAIRSTPGVQNPKLHYVRANIKGVICQNCLMIDDHRLADCNVGTSGRPKAPGALTNRNPAMVTTSSIPAGNLSRTQAPPGGGVSLEGAGTGTNAQATARKPDPTPKTASTADNPSNGQETRQGSLPETQKRGREDKALGTPTGPSPTPVMAPYTPAGSLSRTQAFLGGGVSLEGAGTFTNSQPTAQQPDQVPETEQRETSGGRGHEGQRSMFLDSSEFYYGKFIQEFTDGYIYPDYAYNVLYETDQLCVGPLVGMYGRTIQKICTSAEGFVRIIVSQLTTGEKRQILFYGDERAPIQRAVNAARKEILATPGVQNPELVYVCENIKEFICQNCLVIGDHRLGQCTVEREFY